MTTGNGYGTLIGAPVRRSGPPTAASTLKELSRPARRAWSFAPLDVPPAEVPTEHARGTRPDIPEVSEVDIVRHFTRLAQVN